MITQQIPAPLTVLAEAVDALCARPPRQRDSDQLAGDLLAKRALINRLELDFARDAAEFSATYSEEKWSIPSAVSWMREECRMTSHAASTAVVVGEQMGRLVKSSAALLEGAIGFAHLGIMARTCAALSESDTAVRHFNEGRLLGLARAATVQDFRTICRHAIHGADRELFLAAQEEVRGWRTLTVTNGGDGMVEVAGMFDPEGGAILRTTLDPLARRLGPDDTRAREQRYADALIELCVRAMDRGDVPERAGQRTHLQVTTTMETLLRLSGPRASWTVVRSWRPTQCSAWHATPR